MVRWRDGRSCGKRLHLCKLPSESLGCSGNRSEGLLRKPGDGALLLAGARRQQEIDTTATLSASGRLWCRTQALHLWSLACGEGSYLVDPASSHMLVSKIKPCMSKYKLLIRRNCEWLIKSVRVYLMVPYYSDNRSKATANTCADPDSRRDVFIRFKTDRACTLLVNHGNFTNRTASCRRCFIQLSALSTFDGSIEDYRGSNG